MAKKLFYILFYYLIVLFEGQGQNHSYQYHSFFSVQTNEVIKGIWKDDEGLIWIATDLGVLTFDGETTASPNEGLKSLYTKKFMALPDGQFVILNDQGIQSINQNVNKISFEPFQYLGQNLDQNLHFPKSIFLDSRGELWIGESDAIFHVSKDQSTRFEYDDNNNYHRSFSFSEDAFHHIWVVSHNGDFQVWNSNKEAFTDLNFKLTIKDISSMSTIKGDYLVVGGSNGILTLKVDSDKNILKSTFIDDVKNISVMTVAKNNLLIGTWDNGLYVMDILDEEMNIQRIGMLEFNDVVDLYYDDKMDEIWIAGSENIGMLKKSPFHSFGQSGKYRIESFVYDQNGNLYFTTGEQVYVYKKGSEQKELLLTSQDKFYTVLALFNGNLFIATQHNGVLKYDIAANQLINDEDLIQLSDINSFSKINEQLWLASGKDGVRRLSKTGEIIHYESGATNVIKNSPDNRIYAVGNRNDGLLHVFDNQQNSFQNIDINFEYALSDNLRAEDMAFIGNDTIYLATNEGVLEVVKQKNYWKSVRKINFGEDAKSISCRAIYLDDKDLWVGTNQGVYLHNHKGNVYFNTLAGLPSKIIKQREFHVDNDRMTVGTAKGFAIIDFKDFDKTFAPQLVSFRVGDDRVSDEVGMNSIAHHSNIKLAFKSLSYPNHDILYQSRVLGIDQEWSSPSTNSIISLLKTTRGDYTLEMRAKSVGKHWSDVTKVQFHVNDPWYLTWWAYLIFLVLAILIVILINKLYHNNLIKQKQRLKLLIAESTKEIERHQQEIIDQKNEIIEQKEELLDKKEAVFKAQKSMVDSDLKYLKLKESQLQDQIEYRNKQITTHTLNIIQKNETLLGLKKKLEAILKNADTAAATDIKRTIKSIDESFKLDKDWEDFKLYFEQIYTGFYSKLKINYSDLTNQELKHCALIRLNLSIQECASILGISPESVKVSRTRIRKKIKAKPGVGLTEFILSF